MDKNYETFITRAYDYADHELERWLLNELYNSSDDESRKQALHLSQLITDRFIHREYCKFKYNI